MQGATRKAFSTLPTSDSMKEKKLISEEIRDWKWTNAEMKKDMAEKLYE